MWTVVFWLILANSLSNPPKFLISKTGELSNQKLLFFAHPQWILQRVGVFFVEFSDKNEWKNLFSEKADRGSSQVRSRRRGAAY